MKLNRPPTLDEATAMRMTAFADDAESGITEMTGKLRYEYDDGFDRGQVVGRWGGLKPQYPELMSFSAGPKQIAATIRKGKGKAYERIHSAMRAQMEREGFTPGRKRSAGRATVAPHARVTRRCSHCEELHTTGQHRFHGPGAFHKTHLWGFNPMTVLRASKILDLLTKKKTPLTADDRALLREVAQYLRQNRRTTAKHNPKGEAIGTLVELRYQRTIGKHPGFYKHVFKSRPVVWCFPDGSVWIEPKGKR